MRQLRFIGYRPRKIFTSNAASWKLISALPEADPVSPIQDAARPCRGWRWQLHRFPRLSGPKDGDLFEFPNSPSESDKQIYPKNYL